MPQRRHDPIDNYLVIKQQITTNKPYLHFVTNSHIYENIYHHFKYAPPESLTHDGRDQADTVGPRPIHDPRGLREERLRGMDQDPPLPFAGALPGIDPRGPHGRHRTERVLRHRPPSVPGIQGRLPPQRRRAPRLPHIRRTLRAPAPPGHHGLRS